MNRTKIVIAASSLALLALIAFQVKWLSDSRKLIEEQFDQKVSMAMGYSVDLLGEEQFVASCKANSPSCEPPPGVENIFQVSTNNGTDSEAIVRALDIAMRRFDIHIDYDIALEAPGKSTESKDHLKYTCLINPLETSDQELLMVSFPGKSAYVFGKMKFMLIASILILTFITLVFLLANLTLLRQKRLQKMNKAFFNNMAHEFRTPLTNISLANNLLLKNNNPEKKNRYTTIVKEETKKLSNQVDRILQLSKLENGEYQLQKETICLRQLLVSVIEAMDLQIKERRAEVELSVEDGLTTIEGDKFHLSNAFRNLLENALKYSANSPRIHVRVLQEEKGISIQFEDNGIGIAKQDQREVFEQYYRVDQGNVHDQKGFGLGLAYVKMILDRHQGAIKIFSELHKGTRFDLFLPAK